MLCCCMLWKKNDENNIVVVDFVVVSGLCFEGVLGVLVVREVYEDKIGC